MSAWRAVLEVARRELVERSRSRALQLSLVLLLTAAVGGAIAADRLTGRIPTDDVGLVGARSIALEPAIRVQAGAADRRVRLHRLASASAAARAVREGSIDAGLIDGRRIVVKTSRTGPAVEELERALAAAQVVDRLVASGLTHAQALAALGAPVVQVHALEPHPAHYEENQLLISGGLLALFMALVFFGQAVAQGVTEEKSSRVVELLLTTVSPRQLLAGKILGIGVLGLALLLLPGAAALAAAQIAGGSGLPAATPEAFALILVWFVLGYIFYSVAFAAVGALVSRQEDLNTAMLPINAVLVGAFYLAIIVADTDPNGTVARVAAFLPPLSPMVVPARVVLGDMNAAELALTLVLELLGTWGMVMLAARAYERAILRMGPPIRLRRLFAGQAQRSSGTVGGRTATRRADGAGSRAGSSRPADIALRGLAAGFVVAGAVLGFGHALGVALVAVGLLLLIIRRVLAVRHEPRRWPRRPAH